MSDITTLIKSKKDKKRNLIAKMQSIRREKGGRKRRTFTKRKVRHGKTRKKKGRSVHPREVMKSIEWIETGLLMVGGRKRATSKVLPPRIKIRGGKGSWAQQNSIIGHRRDAFPIEYLNRRAPP